MSILIGLFQSLNDETELKKLVKTGNLNLEIDN